MSAKGKMADTLPRISKNAKPEDVVTVNFVEDGLTAFQRVWYRGQEVSVEKGSDEWNATLDEEGNSWLELDEEGQLDRWGIRFHRPGKWVGRGYDLDDPVLTAEDKARLLALEKGAETKKTPASRRGPGRPPKLG